MLTSLELYEKVDKLRIQKGLKVADLNRLAGISHGTLPSWKQRGTMPTIEVLESLSFALDVPLAALLFDVDDSKLSADEIDLIANWRKMKRKQQVAVINMIKSITDD